jgi:hypothetical protein
LKEVGVSVKDDRVTAITDLGSIVGAIFGIAAEGAAKKAPPHLPEPVDVSLFLAKTTQPKFCESDDNNGDLLCQSDPDQYGWSMTIRINPLPDDKMTASSILKSPYLSNAYLYSACRNAQVKLFYSPDRTKKNLKDTVMIGSDSITLPTTTVQVADSNYLEALAFPTNGKVVARPSCGAESTASDSKTSNAFDIINALATSAKTAKDAKDGKTPPNSKSQ